MTNKMNLRKRVSLLRGSLATVSASGEAARKAVRLIWLVSVDCFGVTLQAAINLS